MALDLFGGAITSNFPPSLIDASDLRQVPDSQEVWLSKTDDSSFILEVLELVTEDGAGESLEAGIKFHFSSLAHDNSALSSSIQSISPPSPLSTSSSSATPAPITLIGTQTVSKFNKPDSEADEVTIFLALWRLPVKNADLVLCVNWPKESKGGSEEETRKAFEEAVSSLRIVDLGLFAG